VQLKEMLNGLNWIYTGINDPPKELKRPHGRPRQTWLRTVENDLKHQNLGLWSAGTELMTVISGVISWKRRRCCRGMLHDDDDDWTKCICAFPALYRALEHM